MNTFSTSSLPGNGPLQPLSPEGLQRFEQGVTLIFSQWTALQMAIQNEWGGRNSREKSQQLVSDIVAWLGQSTVPRYIDELEEMLDENMLLSFNTETEDGSLEEVAEQLMLLHEECLQGNYDMVSKLQGSQPSAASVSQCQKVSEATDDESSDGEDGPCLEMDVDPASKEITESHTRNELQEGSTTEKLTQEDIADGWAVVPPRRRRGQQKK
eukprot:TRINITY_DN37825_c0_g1_i1.p1 TRINITY_DN37825_c0_g1~~TRINITY_DN37825_c0_g1_i1.p1  ORF type:complete len:212 (-),score=65.42 TRINITY_DN37825_c0_g1_i1:237-872(-)